MKTLGLLGGMTYNATGIYYRLINTTIQHKLGGANSAPLLLHSFNHAETSALFTLDRWPELTRRFVDAGRNLRAGGAEGLVICCNIGHRVADLVEEGVGLPVLHIADYTGVIIRRRGIQRVGLLGTKAVMEQDFFVERLKRKFGIEVVVPERVETRDAIQGMIFDELGANVFHAGQRELLLGAIEEMKGRGAEGVVLACTELQFVVKPEDVDLPMWDTMEAHAVGAAEWALGN